MLRLKPILHSAEEAKDFVGEKDGVSSQGLVGFSDLGYSEELGGHVCELRYKNGDTQKVFASHTEVAKEIRRAKESPYRPRSYSRS